MKARFNLVTICYLLSAICFSAHAQGTAFTYQGRLNNGANLANGLYEFQFTLYDDGSNPLSGVSITNTLVAVPLSNGLFTVSLDFGDPASFAIFDGQEIWLGIAVRTNNPGSNYIQLLPRQKFTATPYAITAANLGGTLSSSSFSGTYSSAVTLNNSANHFSGAFTGNGANVTNVNAVKLGGLPVSSFWQTSGNAGTVPGANVLGTTDNQPLEFWVNGSRALKIIPTTNTVNLIGGSLLNVFDPGVVGATIAGGGAASYLGGGPYVNYVRGSYGSIGGGIGNTASNLFTTVAGGFRNNASGIGAFVGGGGFDSNNFFYIPKLVGNSASGTATTIGGGIGNSASGKYAVVGGGFSNTASGYGSFVGGGGIDGIDFVLGVNVYGNSATGIASTVGGGVGNIASGDYATIAGGEKNIASGASAFVGGGGFNGNSFAPNVASGDASVVCGGFGNLASGKASFAAGWGARAVTDESFVWCDGTTSFTSSQQGQFLIYAHGGVGIGTANPAGALHVATANLQLHLTQTNTNDYNRLRMDVSGQQSWEMDVSPGPFPSLSFWNSTLRMNVDYNGNVTATAFFSTSDRNLKENFHTINPREVLDKVAALPISEWNFKEDSRSKHLGPMAQDFYAAFKVGPDDKHIATVDEEGVALAAIQGLNEKVEVKSQESEDRIQKLEAENEELKQRLEALEKFIRNQKPN